MRRQAFTEIKPELINIGDLISVSHPEDGGITTSYKGRVARIEAHAGMRYLLTDGGSVLARYMPGSKTDLKFVLIDRAPVKEIMLDMFTESVSV